MKKRSITIFIMSLFLLVGGYKFYKHTKGFKQIKIVDVSKDVFIQDKSDEMVSVGKFIHLSIDDVIEPFKDIMSDRKSTRLNSSHWNKSRMPSSA